MIEFKCVLILSLIISTTIVTGHTINRRDSQSNEEGEALFKYFSNMVKMGAQKVKESFKMRLNFVKDKTATDDTNCTTDNLSSRHSSMDEDRIFFDNEDDTDITPPVTTTIDENNEKQEATTFPSLSNRSLLDTPIACGGGQQLGKDGKCRTVW